jgi:hypothetical protein
LKASAFKAEAEAAKLKVEGLDRSVDKLDKDITRIPPDAAKAAAAMKLLGDESGKTRVALEDGIGKSSTSLGVLDQRLAAARLEVKRLAQEFNRTGDAGTLQKLFQTDNAIKGLERFRKQFLADLGVVGYQGGQSVGKEMSQGLMGALKAAAPILIPIAAALGVEILAAVGGGALAFAGGGALATGIALQLQSPRVHAAIVDLGHSIKSEFTDVSDVFMVPLMAGVSQLKAGLGPAINDLRPAFKELAPYITLIGRELGHAAQVFAPMFASALKDAGPVLGMIAHELPTLARGFGDFFQQIGHGAKGGTEALNTFIKAFSLGLSGLGYIIRGAENTFDGFVQFLDKVTGVADKAAQILSAIIPRAVPVLGGLHDYVHGVATSFDDGKISGSAFSSAIGENGLTGSALGAAGALQQLDAATLTWKNDTLDARGAALSFKDGLADLKKQMAENGAGFNENTADGRKNVEALNQLAKAAQDVADKTYASTGNSQAAAQAYKQARDEVLKLAQQGHASTAEIQALNEALDSAIKIRRGSVEIEVNLTGSGRALVTNQGTTIISGTGRKIQRWGGIYEHAEEGLVSAGIYPATSPARYAFAEPGTGGEAFVPRFGDYGRSMGILDQAARWYGARVVPGAASSPVNVAAPVVNVIVSPKDGALGALVDLIDVRVERGSAATAAAVSGGVRL